MPLGSDGAAGLRVGERAAAPGRIRLACDARHHRPLVGSLRRVEARVGDGEVVDDAPHKGLVDQSLRVDGAMQVRRLAGRAAQPLEEARPRAIDDAVDAASGADRR